MPRRSLLLAQSLTAALALECLELGFTPSLRCGACDALEAAVPSAALVDDGRGCCVAEKASTFAAARLEVCE